MLVCHYWVVAQSKSKIAVSSNASSPFTNDTSGPALSSAQCPEISGYTKALLHPGRVSLRLHYLKRWPQTIPCWRCLPLSLLSARHNTIPTIPFSQASTRLSEISPISAAQKSQARPPREQSLSYLSIFRTSWQIVKASLEYRRHYHVGVNQIAVATWCLFMFLCHEISRKVCSWIRLVQAEPRRTQGY